MALAMILLFVLISIKIKDKMESYIYAFVLWTIFMFVMVETLSVFNVITTLSLWLVWGCFDIFLIYTVTICMKRNKCEISTIRSILHGLNKKIAVLGVVTVSFVVFFSLRMVPYNWDSMTYHLPRIYHWYHNGSVAHYATNISRQVASPVLGAFVNLNVYVMAGGNDWFVNFLQSFSYLTNGILVYCIAKKLKCGREWCTMAGILYLTMPIAFAEAFTTQVDNYSALWLLSFVYILLDFYNVNNRLEFRRESIIKVIVLGLCVAFGYLSKPSVGVGMVIYVLWLLIISIIRKDSLKVIIKLIVCMLPGMLLMLVPEIARNLHTFHAISAPVAGARQLIGTLHERYVAVNFLKNFTFNLPCVWLYDSSFLVYKYVMRFARHLNIDINNPAIAEDGKEYYVRDPQSYNCDHAVNPVIMWLLLIIIVLLVLRIFKIKRKQLTSVKTGYIVSSILSFVVFNMVLRWEPFISRYMISYLALLCPTIVCVLGKELDMPHRMGKKIAVKSIIYFLCIVDLYGLINYHGELALGNTREGGKGYFAVRTEIEESYVESIQFVKEQGYKKVGLCLEGDAYEYPILQMLDRDVEVEHIGVQNETEIYQTANFEPDVILVSGRELDEDWYLEHNYSCVLSTEEMQVYTKY